MNLCWEPLARQQGWSPKRSGPMRGRALGPPMLAMAYCFLHLFSGARDRLGEAVKETATAAGLDVVIESYDIAGGHDLTSPALVQKIMDKALKGGYHAAHAGFPCSSFSRLRWRPERGMPGPVRSRTHIYGLPSNSRAQQDEADRGTLLACLSLKVLDLVASSRPENGVLRPVTIENPPETDHPMAGSAYCLPEVIEWTGREGTEYADFNHCAYADPSKGEQRYKKPQRFVGRLPGLAQLSAVCRCGKGRPHPKVVGSEASKDSAAYPDALCRKYAEILIKLWSGATQGTNKRKASDLAEPVVQEAAWEGGPGKFGSLTSLDSKRARRDQENKEAIGGMRRPVWSLERVPGLRAVGREVDRLFEDFVQRVPGAARAAEGYGTEGFTMGHVAEWRRTLEDHFGVDSRSARVQLKSLLHYDSPVNTALLEAWTQRAKDPDHIVVDWLREGAPLGANRCISSTGVFPPKEEDQQAWEEAKAQTLVWETTRNYGSYTDNPEDSEQEMQRLEGLGYVKKISKQQAVGYFTEPTVSKLALIVKPRADGTVKRRVIVDALRSGANLRARCPERIILPRPQDVYNMAADLKSSEPQLLEWYRARGIPTSEWGSELVAADLTDAFTHFPVHPSEHEQCISPAGDGKHFYVFVAMFFGHKCAPLVMCRLSALLTRLIQGIFWQAELQLATYIDDPLTALVGSRTRRNRNLSLTLLTLGALGIRLAWHKGARGAQITWIGVSFNVRWREGTLESEIPEKLRDELLKKLDKWAGGGMVPVAQLRTFAGKLTWAAGIYKRARWAVSIVYGAITAHDKEVSTGEEEARRRGRKDSRAKDFLIPVRRFETARRWLATLLRERRPKTSMSLWKKPEALMIVTDASPQGCGGMLLVRASLGTPWKILKAFEYAIDPQDAELFNITYKSHKGQGFLEALAVFLALREWGKLMASVRMGLAIRSDSTVALSLLEKAASSTPALNMLAAEMALLLERLQIGEVVLSHVPGKINILADWLSRPETRAETPDLLKEVKVTRPKKLQKSDFPLGLAQSHDATEAGASWASLKG